MVATEAVGGCGLSSAHGEAQRWGWRNPVVPPYFRAKAAWRGAVPLGFPAQRQLKALQWCCQA